MQNEGIAQRLGGRRPKTVLHAPVTGRSPAFASHFRPPGRPTISRQDVDDRTYRTSMREGVERMLTTRGILTVLAVGMATGLAAGTADASLVGQLGILDLTANGGVNPATGNPWQLGDQYRLAFVTSTSTQATSKDINRYNAFVQITADASSLPLSGTSWKVIGSTSTVDARDNTRTNPTTDGTGVAVFLMDGSTALANNNADLWNGTSLRSTGVYWAPCFDENGVEVTSNPSVFVGTNVNGTKRDRSLGGSTETPPKVETGKVSPNNSSRWLVQYNATTTSSLPLFALSDLLTVREAGGPAPARPIAAVDFEGASPSTFDRNPDDLDAADGITVSSGTGGTMFDGWTLIRKSDNASFTGLLRNDGGANTAGATTADFPARLEGNSTGAWSITIPDDIALDLDRMEFDVRAATGGSGRDGRFTTSLDGGSFLWEDYNLPGRDTGWLHVNVDLSAALYQDLAGQTVSFVWDTTTSGAIDLDTIRLYGTSGPLGEVPEPASLALLSLAAAGLGGYVRRRRS